VQTETVFSGPFLISFTVHIDLIQDAKTIMLKSELYAWIIFKTKSISFKVTLRGNSKIMLVGKELMEFGVMMSNCKRSHKSMTGLLKFM
jgi:hypothetical protein